jgi:hypothetical protein
MTTHASSLEIDFILFCIESEKGTSTMALGVDMSHADT